VDGDQKETLVKAGEKDPWKPWRDINPMRLAGSMVEGFRKAEDERRQAVNRERNMLGEQEEQEGGGGEGIWKGREGEI